MRWNLNNESAGGTGFITANPSPARPNAVDRFATTVSPWNPQIIIVALSYNDAAANTLEQIQSAAEAWWDKALALSTTPRIIQLGPWNRGTSPSADLLKARDACYAAWLNKARQGDCWMDMNGDIQRFGADKYNLDGPWVTGSGKVSTPNGAGNSDYLMGGADGTDANHPYRYWHNDYMPKRFLKALYALAPELFN
jgi:hypothetical protein